MNILWLRKPLTKLAVAFVLAYFMLFVFIGVYFDKDHFFYWITLFRFSSASFMFFKPTHSVQGAKHYIVVGEECGGEIVFDSLRHVVDGGSLFKSKFRHRLVHDLKRLLRMTGDKTKVVLTLCDPHLLYTTRRNEVSPLRHIHKGKQRAFDWDGLQYLKLVHENNTAVTLQSVCFVDLVRELHQIIGVDMLYVLYAERLVYNAVPEMQSLLNFLNSDICEEEDSGAALSFNALHSVELQTKLHRFSKSHVAHHRISMDKSASDYLQMCNDRLALLLGIVAEHWTYHSMKLSIVEHQFRRIVYCDENEDARAHYLQRDIAVSIHIGNLDIFEDLANCADRIRKVTGEPFQVYLTVVSQVQNDTQETEQFVQNACNRWPSAVIFRIDNAGMDMGGFLMTLDYMIEHGATHRLALKLHSKSNRQWRDGMLYSLCSSEERVRAALNSFEKEDDRVAMAGSDAYCFFTDMSSSALIMGFYARLLNIEARHTRFTVGEPVDLSSFNYSYYLFHKRNLDLLGICCKKLNETEAFVERCAKWHYVSFGYLERRVTCKEESAKLESSAFPKVRKSRFSRHLSPLNVVS